MDSQINNMILRQNYNYEILVKILDLFNMTEKQFQASFERCKKKEVKLNKHFEDIYEFR